MQVRNRANRIRPCNKYRIIKMRRILEQKLSFKIVRQKSGNIRRSRIVHARTAEGADKVF